MDCVYPDPNMCRTVYVYSTMTFLPFVYGLYIGKFDIALCQFLIMCFSTLYWLNPRELTSLVYTFFFIPYLVIEMSKTQYAFLCFFFGVMTASSYCLCCDFYINEEYLISVCFHLLMYFFFNASITTLYLN